MDGLTELSALCRRYGVDAFYAFGSRATRVAACVRGDGVLEPHEQFVGDPRNVAAADSYVRQRPTKRRKLVVRGFAMRWQDHIVSTPDTLHGATRFRGTRIPVSIVLENLATGATAEELHAQYPTLPREAIPAAMAYAADLARDRIVPVPA